MGWDGTFCAMYRFVGRSGSGSGAIIMSFVVHEWTSKLKVELVEVI